MKISGHLDLCGFPLIEGWLYCGAWQDEPIRLQVYVGKRLIGECVSDRFRKDLQDAGYGNGYCGFSFTVPAELAITDYTETRLRLVDSAVYMLPDEFTAFSDAEEAAVPAEAPPPETSRAPRSRFG